MPPVRHRDWTEMMNDAFRQDKSGTTSTIDFGFRTVNREDKQGLVRGVFDSVADRYDVMNDLMSGGVHRLWKSALIDWIAPQPHQHLIDLAGGTGDISLRFLRAGGGSAVISDINHAMMSAGRRGVTSPNIMTVWAGALAMPNVCLSMMGSRILSRSPSV